MKRDKALSSLRCYLSLGDIERLYNQLGTRLPTPPDLRTMSKVVRLHLEGVVAASAKDLTHLEPEAATAERVIAGWGPICAGTWARQCKHVLEDAWTDQALDTWLEWQRELKAVYSEDTAGADARSSSWRPQ